MAGGGGVGGPPGGERGERRETEQGLRELREERQPPERVAGVCRGQKRLGKAGLIKKTTPISETVALRGNCQAISVRNYWGSL